MKKLLLILPLAGILFLVSCYPQKKMINLEEEYATTFIDFQQFLDQGVAISPYSGSTKKYSPIGPVSITHYPAIQTTSSTQSPKEFRKSDPIINSDPVVYLNYQVQEPDFYAATQKLVDLVKEKGGNAVFDFQYRFLENQIETGTLTPLRYNVLEISGFAVHLDE